MIARTRILALASALSALCFLSGGSVLAGSGQAHPLATAQASPQSGMPCVCPFPQGYCPLPQGYCPPPSTCCNTAMPLGVPTPYTPRPLGAPCASPQSMASPQYNTAQPVYFSPVVPAKAR